MRYRQDYANFAGEDLQQNPLGFYSRYILPVAIDRACRNKNSMVQRAEVIPMAGGNVLEIGIGAGHSLKHYSGSKVKRLTAIDPLEKLWRKKSIELRDLAFEVSFIKGRAEQIPAEDQSFDTAVVTFTLCSIEHIDEALREIHRVLKPGGRLIFAEHGKAPDKGLQKWQNRINPLWKRIGGGCNLNRDLPAILNRNGFLPDKMQTGYTDGWKLTSYQYWGSALRV